MKGCAVVLSRCSAMSMVAFPVAYAIAVAGGRASRLAGGEVSLVWPAAAVGVIWLLSTKRCTLRRRAVHVGLLAVVALATNLATGASLPLSAWFSVVNVVLSVVTVELLFLGRDDVALRDPTDFAKLVAAVTAGTCGAAVLAAAYFVLTTESRPWETFALFAVRNGATALLGVSIWLTLRDVRPRRPRLGAAPVAEALLVFAGVCGVFYWTFWENQGLPTAFLTLVPAMWVALRYSTTVSTLFLAVAGVWIIYATLSNRGDFVMADVEVRAMLAQAMVASLTLLVLTLALYRDSRARLIAQLEAARDRADHLASHDPLTGLANRTLFTSRLESALSESARGTGAGLIVLDLDGFKAINDTWGHAEGDRVLADVSARITAAITAADTAARLGGDEFAILCPGVGDVGRLHELAERLRSELRRPVTLGAGHRYDRLSVSVGIVVARDQCSPEALLHRADVLMYHAKRSGKDCVTIDGHVPDIRDVSTRPAS